MRVFVFAAALLFAMASQADAWNWHGCVYCDANGNGVIDDEDIPLPGVFFEIRNEGGTYFYDTETTEENGCQIQGLPDFEATYTICMDLTSLPAGSVILLPENTTDGKYTFTLTDEDCELELDWLIDCTGEEPELACWLTGGGVKFDRILGMKPCTTDGNNGPVHSYGGNVFPSCSPDPGDGGNWNHLQHVEGLHFQGKVINRVECGNVPGTEPGSESPVTPFNFINFWGTGSMSGVGGNKADYPVVYFMGRCEDHNEPGSNGAKAGSDVDKYFLHVYTDPADPIRSTVLLVDVDGDATTIDPLMVSGGNLQLHISSCDDPPSWATTTTSTNNGKKK